MTLGALDWLIIALTLLASLFLGLRFSRRGTNTTDDFFVAGRRLSWWLAGTSIVATSFAADTPLAIARIVRTSGLQGNWYWWSGITGFAFCMFFFAPLWRRARLVTDAELIELRYSGRAASMLRLGLALFRSLLVNGITLGWVILGMQKIVVEAFGWPKAMVIPGLVLLALAYTVLSGLWGVVATDLLQFTLAMIGSIVLMMFALREMGGPAELVQRVQSAAHSLEGQELATPVAKADDIFPLLPDFEWGSLAAFTFLFYLLIQWWGGAEGGGGGFLVQRLYATRDERHAVLALWWFQIAHFALRTWPWVVVGLASIVMFPDLEDPELAYPKMMVALLPQGLLGLMVAALFAAFMSTLSTHLNWGASYLTTDVYRRHLVRDADERHYVRFSQLSVIGIAALAGVFAWQMDSIFGAWILLMELQAGAVLIWMLRWYWWRINAWSEITALGSSLVVSNLLRHGADIAQTLSELGWTSPAALFQQIAFLSQDAWYPARFLINLSVSTLLALAVTLKTRPVELRHLQAFYDRVRPRGAWGPITDRRPATGEHDLALKLAGWILSTSTVYLALFGLGGLILGQPLAGAASLLLSASCGAALIVWMRRRPGAFFSTLDS